MKRLLKILIIFPIVFLPTISVIACGKKTFDYFEGLNSQQIIDLLNKYKNLITTSTDKYISDNSSKLIIDKETSLSGKYAFLNYTNLAKLSESKKDLDESQLSLLSKDITKNIFDIKELNILIENELKESTNYSVLKQFRKPGDFIDNFFISKATLTNKEKTFNLDFTMELNYNFINENGIQSNSTMTKSLNISVVSSQTTVEEINSFVANLPLMLFKEENSILNIKPNKDLFKYSDDIFYDFFNDRISDFKDSIEDFANSDSIDVDFSSQNFNISNTSIINSLYDSSLIKTNFNYDNEITKKLFLKQGGTLDQTTIDSLASDLLSTYGNSYNKNQFLDTVINYFNSNFSEDINIKEVGNSILYGALLINGITVTSTEDEEVNLSPIRLLFNYESLEATPEMFANSLISSFNVAFDLFGITENDQTDGLWVLENNDFWNKMIDIQEDKNPSCTIEEIWTETCPPEKKYSFDKFLNFYMDDKKNFDIIISDSEFAFSNFDIKFNDWWADSLYRDVSKSMAGYEINYNWNSGPPEKWHKFSTSIKIGTFTFNFAPLKTQRESWYKQSISGNTALIDMVIRDQKHV